MPQREPVLVFYEYFRLTQHSIGPLMGHDHSIGAAEEHLRATATQLGGTEKVAGYIFDSICLIFQCFVFFSGCTFEVSIFFRQLAL